MKDIRFEKESAQFSSGTELELWDLARRWRQGLPFNWYTAQLAPASLLC